MRQIILIILLLLSTICFSQITNYGPNIGILSNRSQDQTDYQFGFSVRRFKNIGFIQPEVNLIFNTHSSTLTEIRVPVLVGVKLLRTIRINFGPELRTPLQFTGSPRGLNQLTYIVSDREAYVAPVGGVGIDVDKFCIDFRLMTFGNKLESFNYSLSIYYLFGSRKKKE